jgi:hypothetical protein
VLVTLLAGTIANALVRRRRAESPGTALRAMLLAGIAACTAVTLYTVARYPWAGKDPTFGFSLFFAAVLAGYSWLALTPPGAATSHRAARRYGLAAGCVAGALFAAGFTGAHLTGRSLSGHTFAAVFATIVVACGLAVRAEERAERRAARGVQTGLWTGLVGAQLLFVAGLTSALAGTVGTADAHTHQALPGQRRAGPDQLHDRRRPRRPYRHVAAPPAGHNPDRRAGRCPGHRHRHAPARHRPLTAPSAGGEVDRGLPGAVLQGRVA